MASLPSNRSDATSVVRTLRDAGHVAYFAGGCVRDELLGLEPKDYDVATDAPPDVVRKVFRNTQAVGAAFGVVLVRVGNSQIEVATFRTDGKYEDGRRPESVHFTTAEEDAKRRDFTINGMFLDPLTREVIDYVGGQNDLAAKTLRAIGIADERFAEDHLRMLRAVRFASKFSLTEQADTEAAIKRHAPLLARISPERIADELRRMLTARERDVALHHLQRLGLLNVILRFLPEQSPEISTGNFRVLPAISQMRGVEPVSFSLALAAVTLEYRLQTRGEAALVELTSPTAVTHTKAAMRKALKISNDEERALGGILSFGELIASEAPTVAQLKRFLAKPFADDARVLMRAIGSLAVRHEKALARLSTTEFAPEPFVTGDDLAAAGLRPGPMFRRILDAVYDAQLEDRVTSKVDALRMAMGMNDGQNDQRDVVN